MQLIEEAVRSQVFEVENPDLNLSPLTGMTRKRTTSSVPSACTPKGIPAREVV